MRSMTPSSSVKMSTSRFNMVCGKTVEQAVRPNLDRIPNPQAPKVLDSRVLTPSLTRRGLERERGRSQTRDSYGLQTCGRPPMAPARDSSLHVPFGSYAEKGIHSRPGRSASECEIRDIISETFADTRAPHRPQRHTWCPGGVSRQGQGLGPRFTPHRCFISIDSRVA